MVRFSYNELEKAPLIIDAIYEGGTLGNIKDDPLHILLPRTSNQGGFRITHRHDNMKLPAYVVIYTSLEEMEWPDSLNVETGILRYYGDNREPGNELHSTRKKGNELLRTVFGWLNNKTYLKDIPPFLIFRKVGTGRDVQFLGLAVPGNANLSSQKELIAIWKTNGNERFQNYEAYFTVLNTGIEDISKEWLKSLIYDHINSLRLAPTVWERFIRRGRDGIVPLMSEKSYSVPGKNEQLPKTKIGKEIINKIRAYFERYPFGFEQCGTTIVMMMDKNFYHFDLTKPYRDGGRDAVGKYRIGMGAKTLDITFALEAKCYGDDTAVGVKSMSRLISRIKYREFGILITTGYVNRQAYKEVVEDGHPILILTASDIVSVLLQNDISLDTIDNWLSQFDNKR